MTDLPKHRLEAARMGSDRYFTGKACINGHLSPRNTINGSCLECQRDRQREIKRILTEARAANNANAA